MQEYKRRRNHQYLPI